MSKYSVEIQLNSVENHDDLVLQLTKMLSLLENRRIFTNGNILAELDQKGPKAMTRTGFGASPGRRFGSIQAKWEGE